MVIPGGSSRAFSNQNPLWWSTEPSTSKSTENPDCECIGAIRKQLNVWTKNLVAVGTILTSKRLF